MNKTVRCKSGMVRASALVVMGWVCFLVGKAISTVAPVTSISLLAIARVLP